MMTEDTHRMAGRDSREDGRVDDAQVLHAIISFCYADKYPTSSFLRNVSISQKLQVFMATLQFNLFGTGLLTSNVSIVLVRGVRC